MIGSEFHFGNSQEALLAFAIHNGHQLPSELQDSCGIDEATRLREEDPFTGGFAELFDNHVVVATSRFAVDLNRSMDKAVYLKPEDAWGLPVRNCELESAIIEELQEAYQAWYRMVQYQIDRLLTLHPRLLILDLHSYNHHRGGIDAAYDPQSQNPDIIIGRSNLSQEFYPQIEKLRCTLDGVPYQGGTLDCRCDVKFSGGNFSRWLNNRYGSSAICLAIEFKKTFMDEWSGKLNLEAYSELKQLFLAAISQWKGCIL